MQRNLSAFQYQLLTAAAAALALAQSHGAATALLLIHEFINGTRDNGERATSDEMVAANASALNRFVTELSASKVLSIAAPAIVGPFTAGDWTPSLYIGILRTDLNPGPSV